MNKICCGGFYLDDNTLEQIVVDGKHILKTKANGSGMNYYVLTFNGESFHHEDEPQTFAQIKEKCLDEEYFVYAQYNNRLYIPQYIGEDNIFFESSFIWNNKPYMHKIGINNLSIVTQEEYPLAKESQLDTIETKLQVINDYITPEMHGAVGDGTTDDTEAVRDALKESIDTGKILFLPSKYYITDSLLTEDDYPATITVNIKGRAPAKNYTYVVDDYGGIKFANGVNVFSGLTMRGSICNLTLCPQSRSTTGSIFYNCKLAAFCFKECSVSNIGAFCYNTNLSSVSLITECRFLSVRYFAKVDADLASCICTDSMISYNYINGGATTEVTDNTCFQWSYFNGSTVTNNFIDYYRTIYGDTKTTSHTFQGPISSNNHYQVFRYFLSAGVATGDTSGVTGGVFSSVNDCFNWVGSRSPDASRYLVKQYTGHDGNLHDVPDYIVPIVQTWSVRFENCYIQSNVGNMVFIRHALTNYANSKGYARFICSDTSKYDYDSSVTHADSIYVNGTYGYNNVDINIAKTVDSLPTLPTSWGNYYQGMRVLYNKNLYRFISEYDTDTGVKTNKWVKIMYDL